MADPGRLKGLSRTADPALSMAKPRPSRARWVWVYVLALTALAAIAHVLWVADAAPLATPHLSWWMLALGFVGAERCIVHLEFHRSAHTISLADVPFALGLVFAAGNDLVLGSVIGSIVVYGLLRRLPPVKIAFNAVQLWVAVDVAVGITHLFAPAGGLGPDTWIGVYAGTLVSGAVTVVLILIAIAITEGGVDASMLRQMFAMDALVTLTNTSIAIAAAIVISTDARAVPVLLVPALTVFVAYRAYAAERERHERLEFLYEANRTLSRSPEVAEAIEGLLSRSLDAFRSEIAEVMLFGSDGTPLRTTLGPGSQRAVMQPADAAVAEAFAELVDADRPAVLLTPPFDNPVLAEHFARRGVRHAMVAMLPGEERTIGTIMLANRVGLARGFSVEDLRLLEALANNASVALQYDRLEQAVAQLRALQEQLHHQAFHDPLTDLPNRALFMERVRDELRDAADHMAVLFIDVDDFKTVNDSLGHGVGDALLVAIAGRLRGCTRPQDLVARLGGDEFAVMLPGVEDPLASARMVGDRILEAFELPVHAAEELVSVHLSVGIASSLEVDGDGDQLIRNADVAMYHAKSKGKARFEVFEPAMADAIVRRHGLKEELCKAVGREQIVVEYQPIVALDSGRIAAAEALVRWEHPARGIVAPSEFVPLAEETGQIVAIGRHVLREACRQARAWQDADPTDVPLRMHVNLSVVELLDPGLMPAIRDALDDAGIPAEQLVIEITETQLVQDAVTVAARLRELRTLGVRIALDDFGTGYSSLSYLHSLPLDILKVAKPFVDGLVGGGRESSFVQMILDLARALGLEVIAEGIETPEQAAALRELGTGFGQGFHLARPSPAATRLERSTSASSAA
jgi:diguanylate cyclase (GGDEF)-like protein